MEFEDIWKWFCRLSLLIFIIIVVNSILGDILFRVKFSFPHVSQIATEPINTYKEPVQIELQDAKYLTARASLVLHAPVTTLNKIMAQQKGTLLRVLGSSLGCPSALVIID